jgi:hypothetical protein
VLVATQGFYEARCRRCFDPLLTRTQPADQVTLVEPSVDTTKANV